MENGHHSPFLQKSVKLDARNPSASPTKHLYSGAHATHNGESTTHSIGTDQSDYSGTNQPLTTTRTTSTNNHPESPDASNSPSHFVTHSSDLNPPTSDGSFRQHETSACPSVNSTNTVGIEKFPNIQYSTGSYVGQALPPPNYPSSMSMIPQLPETTPPMAHTGYPAGVMVPQHVSPFMLHPRSVPFIPPNPPGNTLSPSHLHPVHNSAVTTPIIPTPNAHPPLVTSSAPVHPGAELNIPSVQNSVSGSPLFLSSAANPSVNTPAPSTDLATAANGPPTSQANGDYYVMVHVDAGATFSVRVGDQIQHIPGPATVRMVSNSGPPIPMPMQVPAGHLVQQIVDEEGILKHVILSLYPGPNPPPAPPPPPSSVSSSTPPLGPSQHNGIVAQGSSIILDPSQHLHTPHPPPPGSHPAHHHPHLSHSPSSVGPHLPVGGPVPLCAYNYPQVTPPASHYHSQFVHTPPMVPVSSHFHPHQFMPTPPNLVCSVTGLRPAVDRVPILNGHMPTPHAMEQILTESHTETERIDQLNNTETGGAEHPTEVFPYSNELTHESSAPEQMSSTAVSEVLPANTISHVEDNELQHSEDLPEDYGSSMEGSKKQLSHTSPRLNSGSTPSTDRPASRDSQTQSGRLLDPADDRTHPDRTTSSQPEQNRVFSSASNHVGHNDSNPTYSSTFCNSSRRRGRAGPGKAHGTFRSQLKPSGLGPNKFMANNSSHSPLPNGSGSIPCFGSSGTPDSVEPFNASPTDSIGPPRPSSGWSTDSNNPESQRVSVQKPRAFSTPSPTASYSHYRGRRTQPNYLLTSPPSSNPFDQTSQHACEHSIGRYQRASHDMLLSTPDKEDQAVNGDWECEAIQTVLSAIPPPQVSDIKSVSALIHLTLPSNLNIPICPKMAESAESDSPGTRHPTVDLKLDTASKSPESEAPTPDDIWTLDENAIQFELHLAERDSSARFNCLFVGEATDISLQDLRPGSDYYVKYCCVYSDIHGQFSSTVHFTTTPTEPSAPRNLTVLGHTRTSLHVKWSAACDNGSRITAYCLEYAPVPSNLHARHSSWNSPSTAERGSTDQFPHFVEGFHGLAKSCKLSQLNPSTEYLLRVMAKNTYGNSPWSSTITGTTSGSPPHTPHTPFLINADVHSLTLAWNYPDTPNHRTSAQSPPVVSLTYILEMDDEAMGHGFVTVFDGSGTEHCVENLRRNTRYRFRLAASNTDGRSRWTDVVTFATLPDRPSAPRNLRLTSLVQPTRLDLAWDGPEDDGGLSVNSYRLEARLPYLVPPKGIVVELRNTQSSLDPTAPLDVDPNPPTVTGESLFCWPHVIGSPSKISFGSIPPCVGESVPIMPRFVSPTRDASPPSQRYGSSDTAGLRRTPSGESSSPPRLLDTYKSSFEEMQSPLPDYTSLVSQTSPPAGSIHFGWFVVYEGPGSVVTLENLIPGLRLWFRVRARSGYTSKMSGGVAGGYMPSYRDLWGAASSPPLEVSLPPVPPPAPTFPPRLVGQAGPTSLHLSWQAPKNSGGTPIVAYEVWQMDLVSSQYTSDESEVESASQSRASPCRHQQRSRSTSECSGRGDLELDGYEDASNKPGLERGSSLDSVLSKRQDCCCCCVACQSNPKLGCSHPTQGRLVCSVSGLECRINGLRPGRTYAFRVRACNLIGRGPWSPWANVSTAASPPAAPSRPPRLLPRTATTVHISWDPVSRTNGAAVTGYMLEWQPLPPLLPYHVATVPTEVQGADKKFNGSPKHQKGDSTFQLLYTGPELTYELIGAQPASRLAFRVCALNSAGPGPWSPVGVCITPSTVPGQPGGLHIKHCLPHSVEIQWAMPQPNGSPITSFSIELSYVTEFVDTTTPSIQVFDIPAPVSDSFNPVVDTDLEQRLQSHSAFVVHLLDELRPDTNYKVRVRAYNALGYGPFSACLSFATLPLCPDPPRFIAPTMLTATSVRLQWTMSESVDTADPSHPTGLKQPCRSKPPSDLQFVLQLSRQPDDDWNTLYDGPDTAYKVTRLTENTAYYFRVHAVNRTGPGAYSEVLSLTTLRLPPPAVRGLKIIDVSADVCHLEWSPVSLHGSDSMVYVVQLMPVLQAGIHVPQLSSVQAQVYRGAHTSCRVTDLVPNTEYMVRVSAVRLCLPNNVMTCSHEFDHLVGSSDQRPLDKSSMDEKDEHQNTDSDWFRNTLDSSVFHVTELPGPYSHGISFTTRPLRSPKSHPAEVNSSLQRTSHTGSSLTALRWFLFVIRTSMRFLYSPPTVTSSSQANTTQHTSQLPVTTPALSNSSLRRRQGPSIPVVQAPVPAIAYTTSQQMSSKSSPHSSNTPKRSQHWFRLSDRKLAFIFLFLFALATLLLFMGLQYLLGAQPPTGTRTSTDLLPSEQRASRQPGISHQPVV